MGNDWSNWTDLIESYKDDLKELNIRKRLLSEELNEIKSKWDNRSIPPHSHDVEIVEGIKRNLSLTSQMITSTSYALKWLRDGKSPDNVTSIENYSYDQRTIEIDPYLLAAMYSSDDSLHKAQGEIDQDKLFRVESALSGLSEKEKETYILFEGYQYSIGDVAEMLSIKKTTVNTMLKRSRHKIKLQKAADIFLVDNIL